MKFTIPADRCFINAPFMKLKDGLIDVFIEHQLQPEIGLEGDVLYDQSDSDFGVIARRLEENNLSCTLHAPFFDLAPGALDKEILSATRAKLRSAFALIEIFHPKAIICHLNFEANKHGYKQNEWFAAARQTWHELIEIAAASGTTVALENTYEFNPTQHKKMLESLNSPLARFCLDTGHLLAFAKSTWQEWLPEMNPWLGHLHLHDNTGTHDSHLAIGHGSFDFAALFNYLAANRLNPLITLEPHSEDDLWASLETLRQMGVANLGKKTV
nr:sugar phosphate isomerase/epimerase [Desulfobulbaceae bacterium]